MQNKRTLTSYLKFCKIPKEDQSSKIWPFYQVLTSSNTCHIKIDIISISHYICLDIRIKDPNNLTDQGNSFVSYRWLTWIMICRILDISRYHSISCITHITLFQNLWQISFAFASWNKLLIKLTLANKSSKTNLKPIHNQIGQQLL